MVYIIRIYIYNIYKTYIMHIDHIMFIRYFFNILSLATCRSSAAYQSTSRLQSPPRREPRLLQEAPGCLRDFVGDEILPILSRDFFISQVCVFFV